MPVKLGLIFMLFFAFSALSITGSAARAESGTQDACTQHSAPQFLRQQLRTSQLDGDCLVSWSVPQHVDSFADDARLNPGRQTEKAITYADHDYFDYNGSAQSAPTKLSNARVEGRANDGPFGTLAYVTLCLLVIGASLAIEHRRARG